MNKRKSKIELLSVERILWITTGEKEAENFLIQQYDDMIGHYVDKYIRINHLNGRLVPKEDIKQEIRLELLKAVRNFKV